MALVLQTGVAEADLNQALVLAKDIILIVIQEKALSLIVGAVRATSQVVTMIITLVLVARIVGVRTSDTSTKSSSSQSHSESQSSSGNSSSKSKSDTNSGYTKPQMSSPELNDSERSNFQSGAKVSDDETLKKYSKQNDDFSDEQAKNIFDNNDDYQTRDRYYRQDVIRNPWFWMYMSRRSYYRYGNFYHSKVNNNAYTKGYQDGFADAEKGIDNYDSYSKESTLLGKFTTTSEKTAYLRGYKDGHDDGK